LEQIRRLTEKEKREVEVKKIIKLRCIESDGIKRIREIFNLGDKNTRISYLSAGNYLLTVKGEDYKKANQIMQESLAKIETKSKKSSCELSIEDKK
jgi:translation initiation factor 2 alpha subunit (eIF-2alpha)